MFYRDGKLARFPSHSIFLNKYLPSNLQSNVHRHINLLPMQRAATNLGVIFLFALICEIQADSSTNCFGYFNLKKCLKNALYGTTKRDIILL